VARTPEEGSARKVSVCVRITEAEQADIDRSRGPLKMSSWWREAAHEKLAREKRR
jgi:hypothetical protein